MRKRLFAVAAAALLPALGLIAYNETTYRSQRSAEVHSQVKQAAWEVSSEVDRIIEGTRSLLIATSAIPAVAGMSAECNDVLGDVAKDVDSIQTLIVLDERGHVACDSAGASKGLDLSDRTYFKEALLGIDPAVGEYTVSRVSGATVLPVARPIRRDGKVAGVIVTGIKIGWLQDRIKDRGILPGGTVTIADRNAIILARTPLVKEVVGTSIVPDFRHLVHASAPGTVELRRSDGQYRIVGYSPVSLPERPLYVSVGVTYDAAFAAVNRATLAGVLIACLGAVLAFGAAIFVGNRFIIAPINEIVDVLDRWRGGATDGRTRMAGHYGELGLVGASVDHLLDELDLRVNAARRAEEARNLLSRELSHRVKNTLAVVQGIARQTFRKDVAPEKLASFSERVRALSSAYDVLLADQWQQGRLCDVVKTALKPHGYAEDDRRFVLSGDKIVLPPQAAVALSLVVHELATNSLKYGSLGADGEVDIEFRRDGDAVRMTWRERGGPPTIKPASEGFGTRLIRSAFPVEFEPETSFDYLPEGLCFTLRILLPAPKVERADGEEVTA